jgi:hypothetical protein
MTTIFTEHHMKRVAILATIVFLAACGSDSNGPSDKFSGTWSGDAITSSSDTLHFVFISTQTGSGVAGSGNVSSGGTAEGFSFTGTSTPPSVNLVLTAGSETLTYAGAYVSSDSLTGIITEGSTSVALGLKKN